MSSTWSSEGALAEDTHAVVVAVLEEFSQESFPRVLAHTQWLLVVAEQEAPITRSGEVRAEVPYSAR